MFLLDGRERRVASHRHNDHTYYRLNDAVDIFQLRPQETRNQLQLHGPRGTLLLSDGRPLIRTGDQYLLLSTPIWKRSQADWYVPEQFFVRALPLILLQKLASASAGRYRVEGLLENQVEVRWATHPDHVRVVFQPTRKTVLRVREFEEYIQIEFDDHLVRPQLPTTKPDHRLISSLEFSSENSYGTFRIHKGAAYQKYREYDLNQPYRKVLEIRGFRSRQQPVPAPENPASNFSRKIQAEGPTLPAPPPTISNSIVLDPGHGGEDYGLRPLPEIFEKDFTFSLSSKIREELEKRGYRGLLTRKRDVRLNITQRSSIGNNFQPRVFISLHIGAAPSEEASGPVVYIHHSGDSASPKGNDPSDLSLVRWSEGQRPYLQRSRQLAETIQQNLNDLTDSKNSVSEAPLAVLAAIQAPAVLVETGFATNPEDCLNMQSSPFQQQLAKRLVRAILEFLEKAPEGVTP